MKPTAKEAALVEKMVDLTDKFLSTLPPAEQRRRLRKIINYASQTVTDKAAEQLTDTAMSHFFAMPAKERIKSRKAARKVMARVERRERRQ